MKAFGPYLAARTLTEGGVTTLAGVDRLTGLRAVLFLVPGEVAPPHLDHPRLLSYTDLGVWDAGMYLVAALPPGAAPASAAGVQPREIAVGVLDALAWLHARGLVHGGLTIEQVWAVADGVIISGAGLPWDEAGITPADDLLALGTLLETLGEVPSGLSALLAPTPADRGTAVDALARLRTPQVSHSVSVVPKDPPSVAPPAPTQEPIDPLEPAGPDDLTEPAESVVVVTPVRPARAPVHTPAPTPTSTPLSPSAAPSSSPRAQPIRIGWEEDHSWRVVKAGPDVPVVRRPWWLLIAVALALAGMSFALFLSFRNAAVACCDVRFSVTGAPNVRAAVTVMSAPGGSGLEAGERLGTIPGSLTFPNVAGSYRVRVEAAGFERGELELRLPRDRAATIELKR